MELICPNCENIVRYEKTAGVTVRCIRCRKRLRLLSDGGNFKLEMIDSDSSHNAMSFWDTLVQEIMNGNVIPVIGEDIMLDSDGGNETVRQILIDTICGDNDISNPGGKPFHSFSQLLYSKQNQKKTPASHEDSGPDLYKVQPESIYRRITELLEEYKSSFNASPLLKRILSIKYFPFVITTATDSLAEDTMRAIWEKRGGFPLNVLKFDNNPNNMFYWDVRDVDELKTPTIYYMFGKADTNSPHRFVVTDEDMFMFCKSWLTRGAHPEKISDFLAKKKLLFIGCSYSDWLMRMIWYSIRDDIKKAGMLVGDVEPSLKEFMERVNVKIQSDPEEVISQIEKGISQLEQNLSTYKLTDKRFDEPISNTDVFISYSRADEGVVKELYGALTRNELNVWYDRKNLAASVKWEDKINEAIRSTKVFLALLSPNMIKEANENHVYRKEWNVAIDTSKSKHPANAEKYLFPVALDDLDPNSQELGLSDGLKERHIISVPANKEGCETITDEIIKRIRKDEKK